MSVGETLIILSESGSTESELNPVGNNYYELWISYVRL
jgi:hypothetical protein